MVLVPERSLTRQSGFSKITVNVSAFAHWKKGAADFNKGKWKSESLFRFGFLVYYILGFGLKIVK